MIAGVFVVVVVLVAFVVLVLAFFASLLWRLNLFNFWIDSSNNQDVYLVGLLTKKRICGNGDDDDD